MMNTTLQLKDFNIKRLIGHLGQDYYHDYGSTRAERYYYSENIENNDENIFRQEGGGSTQDEDDNNKTILEIEIEKTRLLIKTDNNYYLGSNGKFMKINDQINDIPTIFGNFDVSEFFLLKDIIEKSNFKFENIDKLYFLPSKRWDIEFKNENLNFNECFKWKKSRRRNAHQVKYFSIYH